jgi:hypothetical protein
MMVMKKLVCWVSCVFLLLCMLFSALSCSPSSTNEAAMVQIWSSSDLMQTEPLAYGIVVGDGRQILTVINYEDDISPTLYVGLPGQSRYPAAIKALDPRNSVTLLEIDNSIFPAAEIAPAGSCQPGDSITLHGWPVTDFQKIEQRQTTFQSFGSRLYIEQGPYIALPGAIVTGPDGKIIGLLGTDYNAFVIRSYPVGSTAPMIDIHDALILLTPDVGNQPWANGPVTMVITTEKTLTGYASSQPLDSKYVEITSDIKVLLGTIGIPLPVDELPTNYRFFSWGNPQNADGILLSVLYPHSVELLNSSGQSVGVARWIGIQWGRSDGKPNRIFYGHIESGDAIVDGGFILQGDINNLANVLN